MALALCLALSFSNYSNSQDILTTGNLVNQTSWDGCATYLQSRIWGGYSGGPCPNVGTDGTGINFSYGQNTLAQTIAINRALQDTGVAVNGYNYSWQVKNSNINGMQGGSFDPIALVNVQFKDAKGAVVVDDTYNYGYHLPGWSTFSGTQTFANPYVANTLSSVGLSVTSKDSGYWAGYYGPEFRYFSLSLNYGASPPPVVAPTAPKTVSTTYTSAVAPASTSIDTSSTPSTTVSVGGVQLSTTGEITAPDNIPQVLKDTTAASNSVTTTVDTTSRVESNKSSPSAAVMNIVKQIQAADRAVQTRAVQNANQQIAASSSRAQEQAMNIVDNATAMSTTNNQSGTQSGSQLYSLSIMQAPQQLSMQSTQSAAQAAFQLSMLTPQTSQKSIHTTFEPIDFKSFIDTTTGEVKTDTVNRNVQVNELAGGVDIAAMATQPKGYEVYNSLTIKDAGFYAPKDIYGNQTNVDNARALRQLGSDRLHQEMVDQQFRR